MDLKLYNTLTKQEEDFTPQDPPNVNLYTCGPTVYNFAHIGNLRTYIFEDILRRTLLANGFDVNHVMNITDVGHLTSDADEGEDKLEKGAAREGKTVQDVAKFYTEAFFNDTDRLNILRPNHVAPATEFIDKQIAMIKLLVEKGFTYQTEHAIYFDTSKLSDYGKLTGQKLEEQQTMRDIVQDADKHRQHDFALWFFLAGHYKNHALHWPSPWGEGFPGWHIECSAINWQFFPEGTDIHTGGIDHIAIHHTNEIAQYEAALDKPMARFWLHGNFLVLSTNDDLPAVLRPALQAGRRTTNEKMAKSGDNFITLQTLIDRGIDPLAYRYFVLQAHYRKELQFSWEALEAAQSALRSLQSIVRGWVVAPSVIRQLPDPALSYRDRFIQALNDDLNTPQALAILWEVAKSDLSAEEKAAAVLTFDTVLGLGLENIIGQPIEIPKEVQDLVKAREQARAEKNFQKSDDLRQKIEKQGFLVKDTITGPKVTDK